MTEARGFARRPREEVVLFARLGAAVMTCCEWCGDEVRPCNKGRHVAARHFRQLTIDDALPQKTSGAA